MFASDKLGNIYESLVDKCIELSHSQTKFYFNQSIRKVTLTNVYTDSNQFNGSFDFIIFACDAETVLENQVKFNKPYLETHYNVHLEFDQYFIHSNMKDSRRPLEMSFNLSN
ncbi:unnamed protein product [Rotaria magnacalcarata]|uniref:Uncharacterized protein n=1 Tax=Rotaria magnacalcarata TaxID=392030 RepID=A0A8S3IIB4_9BILA|nr:unnamed protein product [Rotaria magnacalcarata]